MAGQLQMIIAENKNLIVAVMEVFEKRAGVVASIAGDFFPVFAIAAPIVKLALDNVESKEAAFMKEQFQKVREGLEVFSEEMQRINEVIKKSGVDVVYFSVEENISNQFRKYMDILNAKPEFREQKKKRFMEHFVITGGDRNLHELYQAVIDGEKSVLDITFKYEEKSRPAMEEFCARLKNLFCIGLIALMGYTALNDCKGEDKLLQDWGEKMKEVQVKINAVIEDCITSFPKQAELDSRRLVRDHSDLSNQQLAEAILKKLKNKYYWVCWSVRIFSSPSGCFSNKKNIQCLKGKSCFQVPATDEKLNVMVSYSASPKNLNKDHIMQLIQAQKKLTVMGTAELLFKQLSGPCAVHTVMSCKDLAHAWSFGEELYYWVMHDNFYVCVHYI